MGVLENAGVLLLLLGLIMYAATAGADFGGGVWAALASGPRKNLQREALFEAIGPVWEANHVWLVYTLVVLFTCFPKGFEALSIALLYPFVFSLVGINFRGAAFAFRHFFFARHERAGLPGVEVVLGIASILTPFFMGMAVSAVASGRIVVQGGNPGLAAPGQAWYFWASPFTFVGGLIGLAVCAYLAPIYMAVRTGGPLREDFRSRAIAAALALGFFTTAEIAVSWFDARLFFERFVRPLPLLFAGLAVLCGILTLALLVKRIFGAARWLAGFAVAFTITGFAAALYPWLLPGQMSFAQAAAERPVFVAVLITLPAGAALLVPSLFFLFKMFARTPLSGQGETVGKR